MFSLLRAHPWLRLMLPMCAACALLLMPPVHAEELDERDAPVASEEATPDDDDASEEDKNQAGVEELLADLGSVFENTPAWNWLWLFLGILGGLIAGKVVQSSLRSASNRFEQRGRHIRGLLFADAASPISLALFTVGLWVGIRFIAIPDELDPMVTGTIQLLVMIAIGWFAFNIIDLVDVGLRKVTEGTTSTLAIQLVPLIRKALRIFVVVVFALFIAQNIFGMNITAWLAGLGIAGLAISLAAQDSVKNLFGSITVLLDKPFAVGDRIQFDSADGFVEEIGFRSTKIRTFFGHLITVPNMKFIDGTVENVSARPFIRRTVNITITYDTPPEKIEQAVQIIRDLLHEDDLAEPFNLEERPPRVYFNDYNAASLNIAVNYWYFLNEEKGQDWWGYLAHGEIFNMRLFRAFGDAGIDFAFPTQTLYLAGDPDRQLAVRVLGDPAKQTD